MADGDRDSDRRNGEGTPGRTCPHCGAALFERHCKYVCPNHGVIVDCSDPFV